MFKFLFFLIAILTDFITKLLVYKKVLIFQTSLLSFTMVKNFGFAMGSFQESSPLFRIVFHSTFGIYLTLILLIFLYLLRFKKLPLLKYSMIAIFIGILGNTFDKIIYGHVIDFIHLKFFIFKSLVFNIADVFLIFGSITLMTAVIKDFDKIWRDEEKRGTLLIDKHYQGSSIILGLLTTLSLGGIIGLYAYSFLNDYLDPKKVPLDIWYTFILGLFIIMTGHGALTIFLFLKHTHHSAGPLISFKNFLDYLQENPSAELKLRQGDYHKKLHECADKIKKLL